jgi:hypothetical protein
VVTHPFHPLRGERLLVLNVRRVAGVDVFSVRGSKSGVFSIPREWTDQALPSPYHDPESPPQILRFDCLLALVSLVQRLDMTGDTKGLDTTPLLVLKDHAQVPLRPEPSPQASVATVSCCSRSSLPMAHTPQPVDGSSGASPRTRRRRNDSRDPPRDEPFLATEPCPASGDPHRQHAAGLLTGRLVDYPGSGGKR